jgi:hypothetical protein
MMDTQQEELQRYAVHSDDIRESFKLAFESVKHLTTLSAGSLALFATFLDRIFPPAMDNEVKGLISISFATFILSLVLSAFSMWRIAGLVRSRRDYEKKKRRIRWNILLPSMFYILGLSLFGTAVLLNVFFGAQDLGAEDSVRYIMYAALVLAICGATAWVGYRVYRGNQRDREGKYEVMYPGVSDYDELVAKEMPEKAFVKLQEQIHNEGIPENGHVTQQDGNSRAEDKTLKVRQHVYAELLSLTHPYKLAVIGSHVSVDFFDFRDAVNNLEAQMLLVSPINVTQAATHLVKCFVDCIVAKERQLRIERESPDDVGGLTNELLTDEFNRKSENLLQARNEFVHATQKDLNQKASRLSLVQSVFRPARSGNSG